MGRSGNIGFLKTGHDGQTVAFGSMVAVIENSTQHLHEEDLDAIAHYLKSLSAGEGKHPISPAIIRTRIIQTGIATGHVRAPRRGAIFRILCQMPSRKWHRESRRRFPSLAGSPMVLSDNASSLIRLMLEGGKGPVTRAWAETEKNARLTQKNFPIARLRMS